MDELSLVGLMIGLLGLTFAVRAEMRVRRTEHREREAEQRLMARFDRIDQWLREHCQAQLQRDAHGVPTGVVVPLEPSVASASTVDPTVIIGPPLDDNKHD